MVPLYTMEQAIEKVQDAAHSPLKLMGRNIYVREGCYLCTAR